MLSEEEVKNLIDRQYNFLKDIVDEHDKQRMKDFINGLECVLNE